MKSYMFLFWGYNVVWIGIVAYLTFLLGRIRQVSRRLSRIEAALARQEASQNSIARSSAS